VKAVVVQYRTKPDRADENQKLVEQVYAELAERAPAGFGYTTLRLEDGVSFVHVAFQAGSDGNPLGEIAAFKAFTENIAERCDEPPVAKSATVVGSYGLFQ
jgi:hypothetical protein